MFSLNPFKAYVFIAALGVIAVGLFAARSYYIKVGKDSCEAQVIYQTIVEEIETSEKLNEIRANEPSVERNLDRMWDGKF